MPDDITITTPDGAGQPPEQLNTQEQQQSLPAQLAAQAQQQEPLTQDEITRRITEAKSQEARNALDKYFIGLGIPRADAERILRAAAPQAQPAAAQTSPDITALTQELDAARADNQKIRVDMAITLLAGSMGFADPSDAVALVNRSAITLAEDGTASGVKEALEALKTAKPHLAKPNNTPPAMGGMNGGKPPAADDNIGKRLGQMARERDEQARKAQESLTRK